MMIKFVAIPGLLALGAALSMDASPANAQAIRAAAPVVIQVAQAQPGDEKLSPEEIARRKAEALKKAQQNTGGTGGRNGTGEPATGRNGTGNVFGGRNSTGTGGGGGGVPATGGQKPKFDKALGAEPVNPALVPAKPLTGTGNAAGGANALQTDTSVTDPTKKHKPKVLTTVTPALGTTQPATGASGQQTEGLPQDLTKKKLPKGLITLAPAGGMQPDTMAPDLTHKKLPKTLSTTEPAGGMQPDAATGLNPKKLPKGLTTMAPAVGGDAPANGAAGGTKPLATALTAPVLPKLGTPGGHLQDLQQGRTQHTEAGGQRTVIEEPGNRTIIQQGGKFFIHHDDAARFGIGAASVKQVPKPDGSNVTVIVRPGGIQIFNVMGNDGRLVRRYRRDHDGREFNLIDNRPFLRDAAAIGIGALVVAAVLDLPPPVIDIPRERYAVEYDRASDDDLIECLSAPPVERLERRYSLDEVLYTHELRERMRHIDLDTLTFDTGSWSVDPAEYPRLQRVSDALKLVVGRHPGEVFLIEGHTDAVGSDIDNLSLSDRRAEEVARVLSEVFGVPPENLVTQGYGEQFLKIDTSGPERANRRVVIRRITPLMAQR